MLRYKLQSLLIVLALGLPVLAGAWFASWFLYDPIPIKGGGRPLRLSSVWETAWPVLYAAAWIAVVIAWRWSHRPAS
jgi:hypothetical protein